MKKIIKKAFILTLALLIISGGVSITADTSHDNNLALNKPAVDEKNRPSVPNINDGSYETYFEALKADVTSWIYIDLTENTAIDTVIVHNRQGGTKYYVQYSLGSTAPPANSADWITVATNENCSKDKSFTHTFPAVVARYIRVYYYEKTSNKSVSIYEIEIFGPNMEKGITSEKYFIDDLENTISNIPLADVFLSTFLSNLSFSDGADIHVETSEGLPFTEGNIEDGYKVVLTQGSDVVKSYTVVLGIPPTISNVVIKGTALPGFPLRVEYDFLDTDGYEEGNSVICWYRAVEPEVSGAPLNWEEIDCVLDKTYVVEDTDKYIKCEVTPISAGVYQTIGTPTTSSTVVSIGNLAWNKPATDEKGRPSVPFVNDGNQTTYFQSLSTLPAPAWIYIDLEDLILIDKVVVNHFSGATKYHVQYAANSKAPAADSADWVTVATNENCSKNKVYEHDFEAVYAKYVRFYCYEKEEGKLVGVSEIEVYGQLSELTVETPRISIGDAINIRTNIKFNEEDESASAKSVTVIAALYGEDGTLNGVDFTTKEIPPNAVIPFPVSMGRVEMLEDCKVKIFIWDDLANIAPVIKHSFEYFF
ncbi:MAG: discoidin domain-containing protein [Firmicutes bacterium]|nr:discoidin domain-containing protein [Bacillota bacterium]